MVSSTSGTINHVTFSSNENTMEAMTPSSVKFVPFLSNEERGAIAILNFVVICGLVSLMGIVANVINIVVFAKLGFQDSMNISLTGLAVSDLCSLLLMLWCSLNNNPVIDNFGLPAVPHDFVHLTGGWPHACFVRITGCITAFIAFERCLCIALPLKIKRILTRRRTKITIVSIFILMICVFSPFYYSTRLSWVLDPVRNTSLLSITFAEEREIVDSIVFMIQGVIINTFTFITVICCTIILVIKLNSKTKWRQATACKGLGGKEEFGAKEKKVVKSVILISTIFIVCFMPAAVTFLAMFLEPEFNAGGKYENLCIAAASFVFTMETVNSSVNIFVYLNMSSKYREMFMTIFKR
ncbi:uncharacterized protein LOC101856054 [Aplysia californica]|uniref:Uncharacterized protein LOC101856054 n=1 Tax=Aplysia californica TaxID=6500 RepID=A0ABM0K554_APLCA|nr:uncharacterized protein LOC101856054 [Aplysia californica]